MDYNSINFTEEEIKEADKVISELGFNDPDFDAEKEFYLIMAKIKKNDLLNTLSTFINDEVIDYLNKYYEENKEPPTFESIADAVLIMAETSKNYEKVRAVIDEKDEYILIGAISTSLLPKDVKS